MTDFIRDNTSDLPDGKSDLYPLTTPADKSYTAAEWNKLCASLYSIQDWINSGGDFQKLLTGSASVSGTGEAVIRQAGNALQASVNGRAFNDITKPYGHVNASSVGILPSNTGAQNSSAWDAWQLALTNDAQGTSGAAEGAWIHFDKGTYQFSRTMNIRRNIRISGIKGESRNPATIFQWPADTVGMLVAGYQTLGDSSTGSVSRGDYAFIENIYLYTTGSTAATAHGILMLARATVSDCTVDGFGGNGIAVRSNYAWPLYTEGRTATTNGTTTVTLSASSSVLAVGDYLTINSTDVKVTALSGTTMTVNTSISAGSGLAIAYTVPYQNANLFKIKDCILGGNKLNGFYADGADANAGYIIGCSATDNLGCGFYDSSFLGNTFIACHTEANIGNSYKSDDVNARASFISCYHEGGQPLPDLTGSRSVWFGGLCDQGRVIGGTSYQDGVWSTLYVNASGNSGASNSSYVTLGSTPAGSTQDYLTYNHVWGGTVRSYYDATTRTYVWGGSTEGLTITGGIAAYGAADTNGRTIYNGTMSFASGVGLFMGDNRFTCRSANPASTGGSYYNTFLPGDVQFDAAPVAGGRQGWVCVTRGTIGTYGGGRTATANGTNSLLISAFPDFRAGDSVLINGVSTYVTKTADSANTDRTGPTFLSYQEGRTATANGTTAITLSGSSSVLAVGDYITINGTECCITALSGTSMTVSTSITTGSALPIKYSRYMIRTANNVTAGSGLAIAYVAPTFQEFGKIAGGAGNSTASPGNATLNTQKGRSAFAAAASSVTITNSKVTSTSIVHATLATIDATLTQILTVVPGSGSFVVTGNAAATGTTNFAWSIEE